MFGLQEWLQLNPPTRPFVVLAVKLFHELVVPTVEAKYSDAGCARLAPGRPAPERSIALRSLPTVNRQ